MINCKYGKGNSIDKYCDNLNIIKGNRFVEVYFVGTFFVTVSHAPCLVFPGLLMG